MVYSRYNFNICIYSTTLTSAHLINLNLVYLVAQLINVIPVLALPVDM